MHDRAGRDPHAAAQGEDRIEHGADRVRERPAVDHRDRPFGRCGRGRGTGPCRSPPRAFPRRSPSTTARCAAQISWLARRAPSPRRQDGADVGEIFGLDEQLRKGRMRDVGGLGRQHELGIGRDVDLAHAGAGIR